ncbi:DinB family protein [Microlunatus speluncae]|uniref:DinB family protein n=1 Tax=Microlunatus speluncae TaxID=2594267 RepID=UPI0012660C69|nr:DinB family protein [Microlunatus speluncae]
MPSTPISSDDHGYLRDSRREVLATLDGLDDYQVRRPMTPTGTNLLGVVKHLIGIEAGYLGLCAGRPFGERLPWIDDPAGADQELWANRDLWATAAESRDHLLGLYRRACQHADLVLDELGPAAPATVPWWPEESRTTTLGALLARVLKDTAMHVGQLQVIRELIDGRAGSDRDAIGNDDWWSDYTAMLEGIAAGFRTEDAGP